MIVCYAGLPGAGKSYSVIENVVIPALKAKRHVVHNLMLNVPALAIVCELSNDEAERLLHQVEKDTAPADLVKACRPGATVVLDEVWQYWQAGIKASEVPNPELEFFKKHRHRVDEETGHATEIYIIDQDPKTGIPAFLRSLVDATYIHTKLDKVGAKGRFRVDVYSRCQGVEKPSKTALLRQLVGKYKPEVWNCYVSHTENKKPAEAGLEVAPDNRASVWKSWKVKGAIVAFVLLPFLLVFAYRSVRDLGVQKKPHQVAAASPSANDPSSSRIIEEGNGRRVTFTPAARKEPEKPTGPKVRPLTAEEIALAPSAKWRLMGVVSPEHAKTQTAILVSTGGRRRVDALVCEPFERDYRCKVEDGFAYFWSGGQSTFSAARPEGANTPESIK